MFLLFQTRSQQENLSYIENIENKKSLELTIEKSRRSRHLNRKLTILNLFSNRLKH